MNEWQRSTRITRWTERQLRHFQTSDQFSDVAENLEDRRRWKCQGRMGGERRGKQQLEEGGRGAVLCGVWKGQLDRLQSRRITHMQTSDAWVEAGITLSGGHLTRQPARIRFYDLSLREQNWRDTYRLRATSSRTAPATQGAHLCINKSLFFRW